MSEFESRTSRRDLLKFGGLGLAGAAFLAACSDSTPVGLSGGPTPTTETPPTIPDRPATEAETAAAENMLITMGSIELLAAEVYEKHGSVVTHPDIQPLLAGFGLAHRTASTTVTGLTGMDIDMPGNAELDAVLVQPRVKGLDDKTPEAQERIVLDLLADLESTITATYIEAVNVVLEPAHRKTLMSHGGASARRNTVLAGGGEGRLPEAMFPPTDLVPGAVISDDEEEPAADEDDED